MEFEELKNNWNALSERLSANEILNKRIIKDMIVQRAETSLAKLQKYDILMALGTLLLAGFVWYMSSRAALSTFTVVLMIVFLLINTVWNVYKGMYLNRMQVMSVDLFCLQKSVVNYRRFLFWEIVLSLPIVILILGVVIFCNKSAQNTSAIVVFAIAAFVLAPLLAYIEYKFVYQKRLRELEKSMEELKEFEKE